MSTNAMAAARRGRPKKTEFTAEELLTRSAVLNLVEFSRIVGMDTSTSLRKERQGQIPRRRMLAGKLVFLTSEVRAWMEGAPVADGVDPTKSRRSREIALARTGRAA